MLEVEQLLQKDQFASHNGIELVTVSLGSAVTRMKILPQHLNGMGIVQGGAIYTLADFAFAAASNSHDKTAVGLTTNITYIKALSSGILYARATEVSLRRTIAVYNVDVVNENDELVAVFQGTVFRK